MLRKNFEPNRKHRVVIYARMSTDQQNPRSPDQQFATVRELIQRLKMPWIVVKTYRDDGVSGRYKRKRPQFQQMLQELKSGAVKADLLLVDTFERLSRGDDNAEIRHQLEKQGVLVLTADSNFQDPTSVSGKALAFVESIRSTEDSRVKAHNVLRGKKDAVGRGRWPGGPAPFGFRLSNVMVTNKGVESIDYRILVPDDELRPIVLRIFEYSANMKWGANRICKALNDDPDVPPALKPFSFSKIDYMLDSEIYYGELVWGKNCTGVDKDRRIVQPLSENEWVRQIDFCEAIVPRPLWDQSQAARSERRRRQLEVESETAGGCSGGVALKYPLSGLVLCAACNRAMVAASSSPYVTAAGEERRYVSYVCTGSYSGSCKNARRIPEEWLRETVVELIRQRLFLA